VTGEPRTGTGEPARSADGWRGAGPELVIAVILVVTVGVAGYILAGPAAPGVIAIAVAVLVLAGFRGMLPPWQASPEHEHEPAAGHLVASSFTGFWRKRAELADGTKSMAAYDSGLRPTLQQLLAARLAERHGVSLRENPELARRLLCPAERDEALWYWIDPGRPASTDRDGPGAGPGSQPGIPPRTLSRLIDRLERL
jgi:hypothetical protein